MGNLKKKSTHKEIQAIKSPVDSSVKRERIIFKDVTQEERQRLRIGVYPYLM